MRFLVPPEARLPAERTLRRQPNQPTESPSLGQGEWTAPERLTLVSLLSVTASVISYLLVPPFQNIYAPITPVVVLSTTLVAYAVWRRGRFVKSVRGALSYCLGGGVLAGIGAIWLCIGVLTLISGGEMLRLLDDGVAGRVTFLAAAAGLVFGVVLLLPMLTRLSARGLRPSESIDRCLTGFGFWGTLVLGVAFGVGSRYAEMPAGPHHPMVVVAFATFGAHALMFLVGLTRSLRRQWWLARVVQGKVPGWIACDRQRFVPSELEALERFCEPWFGRERAGGPRVLAQGTGAQPSAGYRKVPPVPKFLIGE